MDDLPTLRVLGGQADAEDEQLHLEVAEFVEDRRLDIRQTADGAFMEPRGCNRWQLVANAIVPETVETSEIRCHALRPLAGDVPW